jgi:hypothetical protein
MSSKPNQKLEPKRVTIYGKQVERVEVRGDKHYAVFADGTDLAISAEAHQRIAERMRGEYVTSSPAANKEKSAAASKEQTPPITTANQ